MTKTDSLTYEYSTGYITLKAEGYLFLEIKENSISTIETIRESHEIMAKLIPEGPIYILVEIGLGSDCDESIHEYVAQSEFGNRVKGQALIVHELAARLMGNLFLRHVKRKRHIKIFSKKSEAATWLLEIMENPGKHNSVSRHGHLLKDYRTIPL